MQINYYKDSSLREDRADIYYQRITGEISNLMSYLESQQVIMGAAKTGTKLIYPNQIFYVEIVDRRCFAYLEKEVYRIDYSLKSFLETFQSHRFIQISKSTAVNIGHIDSIAPDIHMKMHLIMENAEQLILNRAY